VPSRLSYVDVILATVDLSTDPRVQIDCERCGRRINFIDVTDDPGGFTVYDVEREPLQPRYVRPTGRHRVRYVSDRDDPGWARASDGGNSDACEFECGCGHRRTIGRNALRQKLLRATEPRIRL
jgi:hypothetical protein